MINSRINYIQLIGFIIIALLSLGSCGKNNSVNENSHSDNSQIQILDIEARPGNKRVAFSWKLLTSSGQPANKMIISWNDNNDSLQVPITSEDSVIINNLSEGKHSFMFTAVGDNGARSTHVLKKATVYGPTYQGSLKNREIKNISYNGDKNSVIIQWGTPNEGEIKTQINYKDNKGQLQHIYIPPHADSTILTNFRLANKNINKSSLIPQITQEIKFSYQAAFVPGSAMIDTFKTSVININKKTKRLSLEGPITSKGLRAFKSSILDYNPNPGRNYDNIWVFGRPAKIIESSGRMYEATKDIDILNRMIFYSDRILTSRDDKLPASEGGQLTAWTGKVEPIWPSNHTEPAQAGVEQGRVISHIAFCAKLILQNPAIWHKTVPIGDPHDFGTTYKQRALTYIEQADYVVDQWILPRFIKKSDHNRYYFPGSPNTYKPHKPAPWNQAFMLTDALVRLTECHLLLNDAPNRVAKYDAIVKPNLKWFFSTLKKGTTENRKAVYTWNYALNDGHIEDTNHFAYEAEGLWIAYNADRYGIAYDKYVPFANTYIDVVLGTKANGHFAGKVDGTTGSGHAGGDSYVRWEYFYLANFRPDAFKKMVKMEIADHKIKNSPTIMAMIFWLKQYRYSAN